MNIPKPPVNSDLKTLKDTLTATLRFLSEHLQNGTSHKGFTQEQIDAVTDPEMAGRQVTNETTGNSVVFTIDPSTKVITPVEIKP